MFETSTLMTFLAAAIAIILAPGPAQALVFSRSISDGKKSGIMTAFGLNVGTIFHSIAAALGLSAILATSALAFETVKYLGAAYLIYLGIRELRTRNQSHTQAVPSSAKPTQAFTKAVFTGVLNPKVALFFLAFLPQFVDPQRGPVFVQFLVLGLILASLDTVYESVLAVLVGSLSDHLLHNTRFTLWRQRMTGGILIGLAARLALVQRE